MRVSLSLCLTSFPRGSETGAEGGWSLVLITVQSCVEGSLPGECWLVVWLVLRFVFVFSFCSLY